MTISVSSSRERAVQSPSDSVRHRKNEPSHWRRVPVAFQTVSGKGPLSLAIGIEFLWRRHNRGRLVVLNAHPDAIQAIPFDKAPKPNMRGLEICHALHGGSLLPRHNFAKVSWLPHAPCTMTVNLAVVNTLLRSGTPLITVVFCQIQNSQRAAL